MQKNYLEMTGAEVQADLKKKIRRITKACVIILGVFVVFLLGLKLTEDANKSYNYVVQMPISGEYHTWTEGGLQWQGFGHVEAYHKTSQIEFTGAEANENGYIAVGENSVSVLSSCSYNWLSMTRAVVCLSVPSVWFSRMTLRTWRKSSRTSVASEHSSTTSLSLPCTRSSLLAVPL